MIYYFTLLKNVINVIVNLLSSSGHWPSRTKDKSEITKCGCFIAKYGSCWEMRYLIRLEAIQRVSLLKQVVFRLFGKRFVSVRYCNVLDVLFQWDLFGRLCIIYVKSFNWFLPKLLFCISLNLKVSFIRGWGVKVTHLNKCIQKKFCDIYERFKNLVSSALRKFAMDVFISIKLFIIHQWSRFYTFLWQECHSDCSTVFL